MVQGLDANSVISSSSDFFLSHFSCLVSLVLEQGHNCSNSQFPHLFYKGIMSTSQSSREDQMR